MRWGLAVLVVGLYGVWIQADDKDWVSLFNGKDLDGWEQKGGKAKFVAQDGMIVGSTVPNTTNSFLCTKKKYGDFLLELEFKIHPDLNSGVQVRSECFDQKKTIDLGGGRKKEIPAGVVHGYQVEIDPSARAWTGGIYDESRRGWLKDLRDNESAQKAFRPKDWNRLRIECKGDTIRTWLNDVPAAELKDSMTPFGFIGLQVHGVGTTTEPLDVRFRNLRLKELK
jgi:hypothetical protein